MSTGMVENSNKRITIGLLTSYVYTKKFEEQWLGVYDAARQLDVNLVIYQGAVLKNPYGFRKQANHIFETVLQPDLFDGLIVWSGSLDWHIAHEELEDFVSRLAPVPVVSLETRLEGVPTIAYGNYQGMYDLVQHLLAVHEYRRIAYISGTQERRDAADRFQAYCDCLAANGLAVDPDLVVTGDFLEASGKEAVSILLDERRKEFDAIVAANVAMADGAIQALQPRGLTVPTRVAVVGFDSDWMISPPLTTVLTPFYEMGRLALETCVALAKRQEVPLYVEMPADLAVRRSCGCWHRSTNTEHWSHERGVVRVEEMESRLRHVGDWLISTVDEEELKQKIVDNLSKAGIEQCAVALYPGSGEKRANADVLVMYGENGRFPLPEVYQWQFAESVVPPFLLNQRHSQAFMVAPLFFQDENLGVVVFGIKERDGMVYEILRAQLSSSLKLVLLFKEIQQAQNELAWSVNARTSELLQEVAKHKQTSEALRKSEATTRALLESIPDAIFLVDDEMRFLNFIPSEGLKTAVAQTEYLGLTLADVFPPSLAEKFELIIPYAAQTDEVLLQEYLVDMSSDHRFYEARFSNIGQGNVLGIIRDITERKQIEREREQLISELEDKNAELERFAYTVSHDLKSPLVTIKGFLGFLERDVMEGAVEQSKADIERIRDAVNQMQSLLDDLLELSRIGHSLNNPEEVTFADIVTEALRRVRGQIEEKRVEFLIQPELPTVRVDKIRLVEVMQNLLDNAIKYMGNQTQPTISIGTEVVNHETLYFVKDNGIGIEAKYHEKIFELFDRLDYDEEGTGIGLALVKRIIELHQGRIWVESTGKDKGSTFYFTLPLSEEIEHQKEEGINTN